MLIIVAQYLIGTIIAITDFLFFRRMPVEWLLDYGELRASTDLYRRQQIPITPYAISMIIAANLLVFLLRRNDTALPIAICQFLISAVLMLIIIADLRTRIIPDQFIASLTVLSIVLWLLSSAKLPALLFNLLAALIGGFILWAISRIGSLIMKQESMGMGDVKLLAAAGLITGLPGILLVFFMSFIIAFLPALIQLILRRIKPETEGSMAFGPYISIAIIIVMLFENDLIAFWDWWFIMSFAAV
jgi:leader peptidase (prepilin peptidase)/N-methyltransferase